MNENNNEDTDSNTNKDPNGTMSDTVARMYRWYILGCRWQEQAPMSRAEFVEQHLLKELSRGMLALDVFNRTTAEWELAREDATWTKLLSRLAQMNLTTETSDLVKAIQMGRDSEDNGENGSAGIPAYRPPFLPVLVGAGAKLLPALDPEPQCRNPWPPGFES